MIQDKISLTGIMKLQKVCFIFHRQGLINNLKVISDLLGSAVLCRVICKLELRNFIPALRDEPLVPST